MLMMLLMMVATKKTITCVGCDLRSKDMEFGCDSLAILAQATLEPVPQASFSASTRHAMLCPQCGWIRNKKAWRPSQWAAENAITRDYSQCKVCDGEMEHEQTWHTRPVTRPLRRRRLPRPLPVPDGVELVQDAFVLQEWVSHFDSDAFGDFVLLWMTMSKAMRKMLSHNGAVRSRSGDPCHYRCPHEKVDYFDPANMIYSVALSILAPQLESEDWNAQTRGDICESLMGLNYLVKRGSMRGYLTLTKQVADIVDFCSWMTYRLHAVTGDDFLGWVRWINDNVVWRKYSPDSDEERESAYQNLASVCEAVDLWEGPRCKHGFMMYMGS